MSHSFAPQYKKHWVFIFLLTAAFFAANWYFFPKKEVSTLKKSIHNASSREGYFLVLHFPRVSDSWKASPEKRIEDGILHPDVLRDHLRMLKKNGYRVISLEDAYDFFYRDGKLPKKAVLISLMGFRENHVHAEPLLKELGFHALMFLDVESMWEKIYTYVSWHTTRNMMDEGNWDLAILARQEQNAAKYKPYAEKKVKGANIKAVTCSLGIDPEKFRNQYYLAFQHKVSEGYNDEETSPYHLNMLVVSPEWSADDLLQVLEKTLSKRMHFEDDFSQSRLALDWLIPWGKAFNRKGKMILQSKLKETGATAWLLGTQTWDSMSMETEYKLIRGKQFWIYARFLDDGNYLRFGQDGSIFYLQERTGWGPIRGIKGYSRKTDDSQTQRIRFILRDRYAFAYVNGQRIFRQPLAVNPALQRGKTGFSVWDQKLGHVYAQVNWVRFKRLPHVWLECNSTEECLETVRGHSEYVSSISPVWFHLRDGRLEDKIHDYQSFNIHRSYYKMMLIPTVIFDTGSLNHFDFSSFKKSLAYMFRKYALDGLHFDLTGMGTSVAADDVEKVFRWFASEYPDLGFGVTLSPEQIEKYQNIADLASMIGIKADSEYLKHFELSGMKPALKKKVFLSVSNDLDGLLGDINFSLTRSVSSFSFLLSSPGDVILNRYQLQGLLLCQK